MNELIQRLCSYHNSRRISDFRVSYEGQLPLQEYFDVLDRHFDVRTNFQEQWNRLCETILNCGRKRPYLILTFVMNKYIHVMASKDLFYFSPVFLL